MDAVWVTHTHADHIHGLDDLRIFSLKTRRDLPVHASRRHIDELERRFAYIFDDGVQPPRGTSKPHLELVPFAPHQPVSVLGSTLHPLELPHGPATVYGFRVGGLGYVTDAKELPPPALATLEGVRVLVLNALWFGNPHPTHLNIEEAVEVARRVGAEQTWITHLTHRVGHAELAEWLPDGIAPAHDGLTVDI